MSCSNRKQPRCTDFEGHVLFQPDINIQPSCTDVEGTSCSKSPKVDSCLSNRQARCVFMSTMNRHAVCLCQQWTGTLCVYVNNEQARCVFMSTMDRHVVCLCQQWTGTLCVYVNNGQARCVFMSIIQLVFFRVGKEYKLRKEKLVYKWRMKKVAWVA